MNKFTFPVFAILVSIACPATLKAAVTEEYKSVQEISDEQSIPSSDSVLEQVQVTESAPQAVAVPAAAVVQTTVEASSRKVVYNDGAALASRPAAQDMGMEARYSVRPERSEKSFGITLMSGGAIYNGPWANNTRNQIGLGVALEFPVSSMLAFELEGGYNDYKVAYKHGLPGSPDPEFRHDYKTYLLGGNGKIYLTRTKLRPFVGAGLMAMMYENMYGLTATGTPGFFNTVIGVANLNFGLDMAVSDSISFGARASYLIPVINKPFSEPMINAQSGGLEASYGVEEAALIRENVWRIMGTMTIRL
jgi:hypothetical protein